MASKKKILIYRLGSLGDTVMALPCFHLIRDQYPDAEITLLTNKPVASKAAPLEAILGPKGGFFDNIINYPVGTRNPVLLLSLIWQIWRLNIKTVVNITAARTRKAALRDKLFFKIAGVKTLIGFPENDHDFEIALDPHTNQYEWEALRLSRRIEVLGKIDLQKDHFWNLNLSSNEISSAESAIAQLSDHSRIIAICAGTKMQSKDWGLENWCRLIGNLRVNLPGWTLLMIGAQEEYEISEKCLQAWGQEGVNLCGKTSPRVSAAILKKSRLFVGHDSGPMHLAGCVGTPIVAVFAAINRPRQWFPRGNSNHIIYHETDCAGCKLQTCIEQQKKCILSITVAEVESAVLDRLNIGAQIRQ